MIRFQVCCLHHPHLLFSVWSLLLIIKGIPRNKGAKICVVSQKVVLFMIIQKIHLASRFFIRTVCGSPAMQSCSLHPSDAVHGFGCSQQVICRAKFAFAERSAAMKAPVGLLSDRTVCDSRWRGLAPTSSQMYIRLPCLLQLWSLSMRSPRFENHFAIETVRFQVQLEADGYFSVQEIFAFAIVASRASWCQLAIFWIRFFKSDFKNTCWASPKPDIQHKIALTVHLIL